MSIFSKKTWEYGTEIIYSLQDFLTQNIKEFQLKPCLLCNRIHPLKIQAYPRRSFRDQETGDNEWIRIIVVICEIARKPGKKYTKRLLPDFLVPHGVIRSDKVLEAIEDESGTINIDNVCSKLGCIDPRTAKRYLNRLNHTLERASLALAVRLSCFSPEDQFSNFTPTATPLSIFHTLVMKYHYLLDYLHGGDAIHLKHNHHYYIGNNWSRNVEKKPIDLCLWSSCGSWYKLMIKNYRRKIIDE